MLKLPTPLIQQFDNLLLSKKSFSDKDRAIYKKWLRYYWDFCHKYQHDAFHSDSLPLFLQKLQSKNQSVQQQNQAKHSVSLFFKMHANNEQRQIKDENNSKQPQKKISHSDVTANIAKDNNNHSSVAQSSIRQTNSDKPKSNLSAVHHSSEETGTSWEFVFDQLVNEHKFVTIHPKHSKLIEGIFASFKPLLKAKIIKNFLSRM